jgi:hypothetical protein
MRLNPGSIVRTTKDAVSCELDGEVAILNTASGEYYGLSEVGASAWTAIAEPRRVTEIIQVLISEYEVDEQRCKADLISLISQLIKHGLVEVVDPG